MAEEAERVEGLDSAAGGAIAGALGGGAEGGKERMRQIDRPEAPPAGLVVDVADRLLPDAARPLIVVGLLGGFTTFSAFALQLARMGEGGELLALIAYAVGSILLGLLAASAGVALARAL